MEDRRIDLERLGLRSGQAHSVTLRLRPEPPTVGGVVYAIEGSDLQGTVEVSRTTSGFALRLLAEATISGPCARCLERAELHLPIESREVDQPGTADSELASPYVRDGILDAEAWLHDAIALALPDKVLCRRDCAGICQQCGISLNDIDAAEHTHERPLDPRFAKLRELSGDE